jgi:hypothetical protein
MRLPRLFKPRNDEYTQPSFRASVTSVGISFKAVWDCHVGHSPPRNDVYNEIATGIRPRNDVDYEIATDLRPRNDGGKGRINNCLR